MTSQLVGGGIPPAVSASQPRRQLGLSGGVVVFTLTVVPLSGLAAGVFGQLRIASFSATAIVGAFTGLVSWTLVTMHRHIPASAGRVTVAFMAFLTACAGSAILGSVTRQGVQYLLVLVAMIGAVVLGAAVGGRLVNAFEDVIARCIRLTSMVLIAALAASRLAANVNVDPRPSAIVAVIGLGWFLAEYRAGRKQALCWAFALLIAIALSLSRSALVAGFILITGTLIVALPRQRLRGVIIGILLITVGYWAITSWAPLHDRFFSGDLSLSVGGVRVNTEGRTYVWGTLWSEVPNDLVLGHGPGAASARSAALDPAFDQPHNDYLRLVYDFGVVGIVLFAWFTLRIARLLQRARQKRPRSTAPLAALYAGLGILMIMITDNPLDYPFVMIPFGALVGLGLGAGVSRATDSLSESSMTGAYTPMQGLPRRVE